MGARGMGRWGGGMGAGCGGGAELEPRPEGLVFLCFPGLGAACLPSGKRGGVSTAGLWLYRIVGVTTPLMVGRPHSPNAAVMPPPYLAHVRGPYCTANGTL